MCKFTRPIDSLFNQNLAIKYLAAMLCNSHCLAKQTFSKEATNGFNPKNMFCAVGMGGCF